MLYPEHVASACKTPCNLAHPIDPILNCYTSLPIPILTIFHLYQILYMSSCVKAETVVLAYAGDLFELAPFLRESSFIESAPSPDERKAKGSLFPSMVPP